jgi:hypothetical protein
MNEKTLKIFRSWSVFSKVFEEVAIITPSRRRRDKRTLAGGVGAWATETTGPGIPLQIASRRAAG